MFTNENIENIPEPVNLFKGNLEREGLLKIEIIPDLIEKKLAKLNIYKCPGLDDIHPRLLFELRKELAKPLS